MERTMAQAAAPAIAPPKPKGGMMIWLLGGVVCLAAVAGGFFAPAYLFPGGAKPNASDAKDAPPSLVPLGEPIIVNLADSQQTRYLRVKLVLVVPAAEEKAVGEALAKKKVFLKDWLISYLSDQTEQSVKGAAGKNRVRREVLDQFNAKLFPTGVERIQDILFEEFQLQ
jgi:flagellar basal body-associated protein FliL